MTSRRATLRVLSGVAFTGTVIGGFLHGGGSWAAPPAAKQWVGKPAPAFTLPDMNGKKVDVGKEFGKRPVVLIYYRGVW